MRSMIIFAAALILAAVVAEAGPRQPPPTGAIIELPPTGRIPADFKTYSLFLICNPEWLDPEKSDGLSHLYDRFEGFGSAIGYDNAAVWFWKGRDRHPADAQLAKSVDVERSVRFCQTWKLKPSEGPHIVVTDAYPDEDHLSSLGSSKVQGYAIYKLGNMKPVEIANLLDKLTDQLVLTGEVHNVVIDNPGLWVRLLSATQKTLNSFGCAWSFKISAGPVDASLKACKPT